MNSSEYQLKRMKCYFNKKQTTQYHCINHITVASNQCKSHWKRLPWIKRVNSEQVRGGKFSVIFIYLQVRIGSRTLATHNKILRKLKRKLTQIQQENKFIHLKIVADSFSPSLYRPIFLGAVISFFGCEQVNGFIVHPCIEQSYFLCSSLCTAII